MLKERDDTDSSGQTRITRQQTQQVKSIVSFAVTGLGIVNI